MEFVESIEEVDVLASWRERRREDDREEVDVEGMTEEGAWSTLSVRAGLEAPKPGWCWT